MKEVFLAIREFEHCQKLMRLINNAETVEDAERRIKELDQFIDDVIKINNWRIETRLEDDKIFSKGE